ncbi:6-phosphogluconolactonase [Pacificimonas flava]|uniref:6-phosphogluconolactonase n=1 Tax=Pacificimonas flava TaxID=1234595 RepID=M2U843_9SPHN|nr:6-phosphogluconolactonase [Pacificimonas flava]EMD84152.1 6-phosphogluconolactonase [Pacificimonas flava]MBB5279970.1 6-phosphogluconolactonase [Pacificimonas flava]
MTELELWEAEDADEFASSIAGDIGFIIDSALDARRQALIALPWEDFLAPAYDKLAEQRRDWRHVTFVPTHDDLVPVNDPTSKVAKLAKLFMPKGARVLPLSSENPDYKLAGSAANARLQDLGWPLDLVLMTFSDDGEAAGFVDGPDLAEAIESPDDIRALGVETPGGRQIVSISGHAVAKARTVLFALRGQNQAALEAAGAGDTETPLGQVLRKVTVPVDAHVLTD